MLILYPLVSSLDAAAELPTYVVVLLTFGPISVGLSIFIYYTRHRKSWQKGDFPIRLKYKPDNVLEAYLALGARLVHFDQSRTLIRVTYINDYFNRYFKLANYNFSDSLVFSMKFPIITSTVCDWFNKHIERDEERAQVIYFITGLALIRGGLSEKEHQLLKQITLELNLPLETLRRIIAVHISYKAHQQSTTDRSQKRARKSSGPRADRLVYCSILGVKESDDVQIIKKAYRALAKQQHPDMFANASEGQQKMAEEKFKEIQRAYEYLVKDSTNGS
ncbi:MAG: DnaJ like chaperone protein [Flavobacteriaceae bacterium]|jgi:DnaJ like chaperone protein